MKTDGGPAFPEHDAVGFTRPGMTLRDWFAGQALATMKLPVPWSDNPLYWEGVARTAYVAADAMLTERLRATTASTPRSTPSTEGETK